jgi:flagellar basal-body rod protein FlgF
MSRDIYPSLSGATASWRHIEVIAHNIANVSTTGFKSQKVGYEQIQRSAMPLGNSYVRLAPGGPDLSDGSIIQDGVDTHLALQGKGFFVVDGGNGREVLMRGGDLLINPEGQLVTRSGQVVQGEAGPFEIPEGERPVIDLDGTVRTDRGNELGKLRIVQAKQVESLGTDRYRALGETEAATEFSVHQGALESSNVNPMLDMVQLMEAAHHFEIYHKAMLTSDELDKTMYSAARG